MNLIYVGDKFYEESKTILSSLYTEDGYRSDWGKVKVALRNGETVNIRPATSSEIKIVDKQLAEIKNKFNKEDKPCQVK